MEIVYQFLKDYIGITDRYILDEVTATATIQCLKKGEHLIEQGDVPAGLTFLLEGLLRGFFLNYEGKEITDCFGYRYGATAMPYADMMQPSPICIEALEDSKVLFIPTKTMQKIISNSIEAVHIYNRLLLEGASEHWDIKVALYQYSAAERYQWFLARYEGLIDRVPHRYIASFLGMTPVSLSRLRGKLKEKEYSEYEMKRF